MHSQISYILGSLTLLAISYAAGLPENYTRSPQGQLIRWGPCPTEINAIATSPITCGNFTVPLDYTGSTNETIDLELVRVSASKGPSRGSIFFNFGGPGDSGKESLPLFGKNLLGYDKPSNDF